MQRAKLPTALVALLICLSTMAVPAMGQYQTMRVDESQKRNGTKAKAYARRPSPELKELFTNYIRNYVFAKMTQYDPESLAGLGQARYDFMRNYLWGAEKQVQQDLTKLTFGGMSSIVRSGKAHPAVSYNAMLLIGQMDAEYASGPNGIAKPLPAANSFLTGFVNKGVDTPEYPPAMIVGALVGLERHAKSFETLPAQNKVDTTNTLLKVMNKDSFPQNMDPSVAHWIKLMAARAMANIGDLGNGNAVHIAMMKNIGDESSRLNTRVRVAQLLESYEEAYRSASGIDEKGTVQTLMQLATDIAADEKQRAEEYEEKMVKSGGAGFGGMRGGMSIGMGGFGGMGNQELEIPDEYQLRRLVMRLDGLDRGIAAVKPAIKDGRLVGLLDEVLKSMDPVLAAAKDKDVIILNLAGAVQKMADEVTTSTAAVGVEAVEAPPENEEEALEQMLEEEEAATEDEAASEEATATDDSPF